MALPNETWTTSYPGAQDTVDGTGLVEQPNLTNDTYPGAEDGHRILVEHLHALRDKLQSVCVMVGTTGGDPATSHEKRIDDLELGGGAHAPNHIKDGSDEIDGDKIDIDWDPTNYTPDITPAQVDNVDHLTAHLKGIDDALVGTGLHAGDHITGGSDEIDGDRLDIDWAPANYTPTIEAPATNLDHLTAHLKGIDLELADSHTHTNEAELALVSDGDHDVRTDNPHSVSATQVGNTTAQWNANALQGNDVHTAGPTDGQVLAWNNGLTRWEPTDAGTPGAHANSHIKDGTDQIDGDQLDIDWNPANYTPTIDAPATDVDHLTAHLKGIDDALGAGGGLHAADHITGGGDEIDGDKLDIDWTPTNYTPEVAAPATDLDHLTSHLKGIDVLLADHNANHILAGDDEIDGDKLGITWAPTNYTPTVDGLADNVDHLTAHLKGIDLELNGTENASPAANDFLISKENIGGATRKVQMQNLPLATASNRGQCPPLSTVTTEYLKGNGTWGVPAGDGGYVAERFVTVAYGGTTGDYANLNAAVTDLNAGDGGTILLIKGTYTISTAISVTTTINIIGVEEDVILTDNVTTGYMLTFGTGSVRCHIQNLSFVEGSDDRVLDVQSSDSFSASNCKFGARVRLTGPKSTTFTSCYWNWTSSGYLGWLLEIGGNDAQVLMERCHFYGKLAEDICYINVGASSDKEGHIAFKSCLFDADDCGGFQMAGGGQLTIDDCQFIGRKAPTGSIPPILDINAQNLASYFITNTTVRIAYTSGNFDANFIKLVSSGDEADIVVDGLYVDLDEANLMFTSYASAPLYISGSSISIRNMTLVGVYFPGLSWNSNDFGVVVVNPVDVDTTPKQQGHIDFDNCVFRNITTMAGFDNIKGRLIVQSGTGTGNLSFRNCYFDGRDMTQAYSTSAVIEILGDAESLSVKDCVFRGGKWRFMISTIDTAVAVHGCRFEITESGIDGIGTVMDLYGVNTAAHEASTCSVIGNHIIRVDMVGDVIDISGYRRVAVANNVIECASATTENDLNIGTTGYTTIMGNSVAGKILVNSGTTYCTVYGNIADSFTINTTPGNFKPATIADHNLEL